MKNIDFDEIEIKYKGLIDIAKKNMSSINDFVHDENHMYDVVHYTKELIKSINEEVNIDACIISAYWHDVGRTKINEGHEKLSAEMLKEEMKKQGYDNNLINKCYEAIEYHKWSMQPKTIEGLIVKDADKLAWLGMGRWNACINNNQKLDNILDLLPRLRNEFLYFEESKLIYDIECVNLIKYLYKKYIDKMK
ncbi:MAG: HD domain-containing protein [Clostridia bacterium]|nr:HD domain-containing protein [Clostridia bacterium]